MRGDLRAAAVHDDRPQPGVAQEHDVLGERRAAAPSSVIALPPYLTTTVLPWNRSSQGSASTRMAGLRQRGRVTARVGERHVEYAEFSWT